MDIFIPVLIVAIIGLIAGVGLALASKFMAVPVDEKQEKLRECLPGANCGACGFSGCDGYAAALASGGVTPDKCAPGGNATAEKLGKILGVAVEADVPKTAFIACNGHPDGVTQKYAYNGMMSCTAASLIHGGPLDCTFGCIGFGDCYRACPFGAISMKDGRPIVCEDLCAACGKCVAACPKGLISLIEKGKAVHVACHNTERGVTVVKGCTNSCLACRLCEKNCPSQAVTVVNNLAVIDYNKCTGCGKCREVCKRGVIL